MIPFPCSSSTITGTEALSADLLRLGASVTAGGKAATDLARFSPALSVMLAAVRLSLCTESPLDKPADACADVDTLSLELTDADDTVLRGLAVPSAIELDNTRPPDLVVGCRVPADPELTGDMSSAGRLDKADLYHSSWTAGVCTAV